MSSFTKNLSWRRAAKAFGSEGENPNIEPILEAIHMAPSSFGIQPYTVKVVTKPELIQQLPGVCYGQAHVGQASAVLVFVAKKDCVAAGDKFIALRQLKQYAPPYAEMIEGSMSGIKASGGSKEWCKRQAYIALGFGLAAAAEHKVASCPMEGFNGEGLGKLVGVKDDEEVCVVLALGRMPADDAAYTGGYPQWRHDKSAFFERI